MIVGSRVDTSRYLFGVGSRTRAPPESGSGATVLFDERVVVGMGTFEDEGSTASRSADLSLLVFIIFIKSFAASALIVAGKEPIFRVEAIRAKWESPSWSTTLRNENK